MPATVAAGQAVRQGASRVGAEGELRAERAGIEHILLSREGRMIPIRGRFASIRSLRRPCDGEVWTPAATFERACAAR